MKLLYRCPSCLVGQRLDPGYYVHCAGCGKQNLLQPEGHGFDCRCATCKMMRRHAAIRLKGHNWERVAPKHPTLVTKHACACGLVRIKDPDTAQHRYHRDGLPVKYHPACSYETSKS